jgi:tryptophanyl-tRNA synthetase
MTPRPLLCRGVLSDSLLPLMQNKTDPQGPVRDPNSKSQAKKKKKLEAANLKKALKAREKEAGSMAAAGVAALRMIGDKTESDGTITSASSKSVEKYA